MLHVVALLCLWCIFLSVRWLPKCKACQPTIWQFLTSWHGFTLALSPATCSWGNSTCQFHTILDVMGSMDTCLAGDLFVHHSCSRSQMHQISLSCTEQNAHTQSLWHTPGPLEISKSAICVVSSNFGGVWVWFCAGSEDSKTPDPNMSLLSSNRNQIFSMSFSFKCAHALRD